MKRKAGDRARARSLQEQVQQVLRRFPQSDGYQRGGCEVVLTSTDQVIVLHRLGDYRAFTMATGRERLQAARQVWRYRRALRDRGFTIAYEPGRPLPYLQVIEAPALEWVPEPLLELAS